MFVDVCECVCVCAGNVAAGIGYLPRILAHYPEVTAHAWLLPP